LFVLCTVACVQGVCVFSNIIIIMVFSHSLSLWYLKIICCRVSYKVKKENVDIFHTHALCTFKHTLLSYCALNKRKYTNNYIATLYSESPDNHQIAKWKSNNPHIYIHYMVWWNCIDYVYTFPPKNIDLHHAFMINLNNITIFL